MKAVIGFVALAALAVVGYLGYERYEESRFIEALVPHVKNASLRVSNAIRVDTDQNNITYKELFEKLEADIAEVDKHLLEVQSLSTPKTAKVSDPVVAYLRGSQELLRGLLLKYRKALAYSSAIEWTEKQTDELRESSTYGFEYAKHSAESAVQDMNKASVEYRESLTDLVAAARKLHGARSAVDALIPPDALVADDRLEAIIRKNLAAVAKQSGALR